MSDRVLKMLEGDYSMDADDRANQIDKITKKLPTLPDTQILDIADNIYWGAKKFYDPTKEIPIPQKVYLKILDEHPEWMIWTVKDKT